MEVATTSLLIVLGLAAACIAVGVMLLGRPASSGLARVLRVAAWLLVLFGTLQTAAIAALQLTARLGPAQVWFRAPSFFVAVAILLAVATWWFRRDFVHPGGRLIKYALPAVAVFALALAVSLKRMDGRSVPLSAFMPTLRKVVLVNFWATWCVPCRKEMPMLSGVQSEYRDSGLVVIYLSLEDQAVLDAFLRTNHFDGVQGRLAKADEYYHAGEIYPLSYLISRDGRVAQRWSGRPAEDWLRESIREEL